MAALDNRYGFWSSPITPDMLANSLNGLKAPKIARDGSVFWLETRPGNAGRTSLVQRLPDGQRIDWSREDQNIRTRVHEYGGGAWGMAENIIVAVNNDDQRVHLFSSPQDCRPITPETDGQLRYADFEVDPVRQQIFCVREDHRTNGEPHNALVALPISDHLSEGVVLDGGHDFVSSPRLSPDGRHLAWVTWDHPNMPWDGSRLWMASIDPLGHLTSTPECIAGGLEVAITQPRWAPDGALWFLSDKTGWWNLWRYNGQTAECVIPHAADFCGPPWEFAQHNYGFTADGGLCGLVTIGGMWKLWRKPPTETEPHLFELPYSALSELSIQGDRCVMCAGGATLANVILALDLSQHGAVPIVDSGALPVSEDYLSDPEVIIFPVEQRREAHAFLYMPKNADHQADAEGLPPLIIRAHGGPTSSASTHLRLATQYWTSRGFALVDVNYGGSAGFGRPYRERLTGQWGARDVRDCLAAAQYLIDQDRVDAKGIFISGSSAGGLTVLNAMADSSIIRGGVCLYGVTELSALLDETHKFESRYLDKLIGQWPEDKNVYDARSPMNYPEKIQAPVLFCQGEEDRVVPPSQTEGMYTMLKKCGVETSYHLFPGEQHGFRKPETIVRVAELEEAFYRNLLERCE